MRKKTSRSADTRGREVEKFRSKFSIFQPLLLSPTNLNYICIIYRRTYEHTGISFFFRLCSFPVRRTQSFQVFETLRDCNGDQDSGGSINAKGRVEFEEEWQLFFVRTWNEIKKGRGIIDPLAIYITPIELKPRVFQVFVATTVKL